MDEINIPFGITQDPETKRFMNEIMLHNKVKMDNNAIVRLYGITQDPKTKNYIMVLEYAEDGTPEILRGQNYTTAADIYSFGIVMYEVISGLPPYHDLNHDNNLAIKVCKGIRPRFNIKVPQLIVHLIKKCLDSNPLNRPTAEDIYNILLRWQYEPNDKQTIELQAQIKEADEINNNSSNSESLQIDISQLDINMVND
ncbi:kinase-like domain-containing protein [Rhizophagus irregularis DAOM 181602=DAOM 197198]|nr:kinase-like domain-containing protein [Rhizophagus irregularis DAOM 181602=DAOM 197198]